MRLLEWSEYSGRTLYEEKETSSVRGNKGLVLPRDAIFQRIGVNVSKYSYHRDVINLVN